MWIGLTESRGAGGTWGSPDTADYPPWLVYDANDPGCVKNSTRYNRTRNFWPYGHAESKKTQKFVFRSALRPNQISFSHDQDPNRAFAGQFGCAAQRVILMY